MTSDALCAQLGWIDINNQFFFKDVLLYIIDDYNLHLSTCKVFGVAGVDTVLSF